MNNEEKETKVVVRPSAETEVKKEAPLAETSQEPQVPAEKKDASVMVKEDRAKDLTGQQKEDPAEVDKDDEESPEADVEINVIDDRDEEAQSLIRWGAARAGVIVVAPVLGTGALIANELYMITKLGTLYGVEISHKAILAFIGSLGATVVGSTLATLIPLSVMQIPIGISVTYGVGQAAFKWIKDGMPDDTRPYKDVFEKGKQEGRDREKELENNPNRDIPLGDESKTVVDRLKKSFDEVYPVKAHKAMDRLADELTDSAFKLGNKVVDELKKKGVTDEQIDKAKYTAMGAGEVASEMTKKKAEDLKAEWEVKSKEFREEALKKAGDLRTRAKSSVNDLHQKKEQMKEQSAEDSKAAQQKTAEIRAEARAQVQKAKIKAEKAKLSAVAQAETAKVRAEEVTDAAKASSAKYSQAAQDAARKAGSTIYSTAKEYQSEVVKRAAEKQAAASRKAAEEAQKSAVHGENGEVVEKDIPSAEVKQGTKPETAEEVKPETKQETAQEVKPEAKDGQNQ